jgi:hypothetical protein
MTKFKFDLIAGCTIRSSIRNQLKRSKDKLEYQYPGSKVTISEERGWFDSRFYIHGLHFPETDEFVKQINK